MPYAHPKVDKRAGATTRDVMKIDDIEGTKSTIRHKGRDRSNGFSNFDYNDVTKVEAKSRRCSNPLEPVYTVYGEDGKPCEIGLVDGSRPCRMPERAAG